jgi:NADH-quinone oxidoreductase subunit M
MLNHLLTYLIFLPILTALVALLIPKSQQRSFRLIALTVSIIQVLLLSLVVSQYQNDTGVWRLTERIPWFTLELGSWTKLQAEYHIAVDGLSLPLIALTVIVMLIATISSWTIDKNVKGYFILLLILNSAIMGSFTALDLLLFYLFFEFMLLPMFFLIGIWGGPRREYASIKFFLYTLCGSILILIVFIGLYISAKVPGGELIHTFNIPFLYEQSNFIDNTILHPDTTWRIAGLTARTWAFILLFIGFGIKLPMVPFHTWLPDAHVEAPTPISVILAALLLKIGGYGILRIAYPVFKEEAISLSWMVALMGVISIVYGALTAMASKDLKRLIAYSSVSHMGFVLLGIAGLTTEAVAGAVYQMFSHGLITSMLFLIAGVLYDRTHDRIIDNYSGLVRVMPSFFVIVLIAFFASLGLPGFSGFIAEILVLLGSFKSSLFSVALPVIATAGLVLSAAYYLWTIQRMFFGPFYLKGSVSKNLLTDLNKREYTMLVPLAIATLLFGILPQLLLNYINPFAQALVDSLFTNQL